MAGFRRSFCKVAAADYAVRRINAVASPLLLKAQAAEAALVAVAQELIGELHPSDFELLVDLIFARSGWRRVGALGGVQADADLMLVHQATGERAFVQVKSRADAGVFADYVRRYRQSAGLSRMFFVCHTPHGEWPVEPDIAIWRGETLAAQAVGAGLFGWLSESTR